MFSSKFSRSSLRFFDSFSASVYKVPSFKPSQDKLNKLIDEKQQALFEMKQRYPKVLSHYFVNDRIVYTLQDLAPEKMCAQGGLMTSSSLWLSNTGSGDNDGCIAFSLLPEVTTLFTILYGSKQKLYLYAFLLQGEFLLPGGPWRQVISPKIFPLISHWACRELLTIDESSGKVILGPMIASDFLKLCMKADKSFIQYGENKLIQPEKFDVGDDVPYVYGIKDSKYSAKFQKKILEHYENVENKIPTPV